MVETLLGSAMSVLNIVILLIVVPVVAVYMLLDWDRMIARIDALVPAQTDPVSGQPESKAAVVQVARMNAAWYGFAVSSRPLTPSADYWALAPSHSGWRAELAGREVVDDWEEWARALFDLPRAGALSLIDTARCSARIAFEEDGHLSAALFVAPRPVAVMRDYLATLPGSAAADVLTGRTPADVPDPGPILCSCLNVGVKVIVQAVEAKGLMSVEAVGAALGAGTNCGSCRPEIAALLDSLAPRAAAE